MLCRERAPARANPSVVQVLSDGKTTALGTIVGADGWVLTKYTQLGDKLEIKLADGKTLGAASSGDPATTRQQ